MAASSGRACYKIVSQFSRVMFARSYSVKIRRRHINVLTQQQAKDLSKNKRKLRNIDEVNKVIPEDHSDVKNSDSDDDSQLNLPKYEKLKEMDTRFTNVMTELKSKNRRRKSQKILLEGKRLISDAISAGATLQQIFFSSKDALHELSNSHQLDTVPIYRVFYRHLKVWSDLTTFPGIMGVFKHPEDDNIEYNQTNSLPINIICDNIREPGNLGVVIRCAAGAGCNKVILTKGCVDAWNPKVLRGGSGAHFRIPIISNVGWEVLENYCLPESTVILADSCPQNQRIDDSKSAQIRNVFAHELQTNEDDDKNFEVDETGAKIHYDNLYLNDSKMELYKKIGIESMLYSDIAVGHDDEVNIVIGGEAEGLSGAAHRFAYKNNGKRAYIPMDNNVESLNCAVASGIILYDVRRKLTLPK